MIQTLSSFVIVDGNRNGQIILRIWMHGISTLQTRAYYKPYIILIRDLVI